MASWEKVDTKIYILDTQVSYQDQWSGKARTIQLVFRIDGREGSYRVDVAKPPLPIWEAIDGGDGFRTVREAQVYVSSWRSAVVLQGNLTPDMREVRNA